MFCSISGHAPEEPVISTKSGHLYEKRLVEKHVQEHGTCPVTGQSLSLDDLVAVKGNKIIKPRASPATSIPGLLSIFHNEWDALMLEAHALRKDNHSLRQELSHALYLQDAATRVIARLNRENGDLKRALEELGSRRAAAPAEMANGGVRKETEGMEDPAAKRAKAGLTAEIVEEISAKNADLSRNRRKRAVPPGTASKADVGGYALADSFALHDTTKGGILSIAVRPDSESEVATGGADASVQLFDWKQKRSVASLSGHSKKVRSVAFAGRDLLLSGSDDKTVRLWRSKDSGFEAAAVLSGTHSDAVQAVEVHPVQKYAVSVSADKSWAFYDVDVGACLKVVTHGVGGEDKVGDGYTCAKLHPDGVILAAANAGGIPLRTVDRRAAAMPMAGSADKKVHIWEVREQKYMTTFAAHTGAVRSLSFSENGYQLATAADDGIRLWDLRKLKNFHTITPFDAAGAAAVAYDFSGQFLACGGPDAQIYAGAKTEWSRLATVQDVPKKGVLSLAWGANARQLFVGCSDHNLRVIS